MPLVVHYWADLQSVHGLRCYGNTRNAWQSPAVIRQAHTARRTRYACRRRLPSPAIKSTRLLGARRYLQRGRSFRPYCGDVVTRTRNVSEYMLVLALCLVNIAVSLLNLTTAKRTSLNLYCDGSFCLSLWTKRAVFVI